MDFCLNEYSLHGQFCDLDSFCESLRTYTLPVINKAKASGSIIWNRDCLLNRNVCDNLMLGDVRNYLARQNKSSVVISEIMKVLQKLLTNKHVWNHVSPDIFRITDYYFDDGQHDTFDDDSCFYQAIRSKQVLLSFQSNNYSQTALRVKVQQLSEDGDSIEEKEVIIHNAFDLSFFYEDEKDKWRWLPDGYTIVVRPRENDYHEPHFHVTHGDVSMVFGIEKCDVLAPKDKKIPSQDVTYIEEWYEKNKEELAIAWKKLHELDAFW